MSSMVANVTDSAAYKTRHGWMGRAGTLIYSLICYAAFLVTILYAIAFIANVIVPKTIDAGSPAATSLFSALLINGALLGLFVIQHTIMARPAFKRIWTRIVPPAAERSTFVLAASACLGLLLWQWRPLPQVVWSTHGVAAAVLTGVSAIGWAIAVIAMFTISHMDLFGVRQAWLRFRNQPYSPIGFRLTGLYRLVRHPLMLGFLIAFWATPTMTVGHLFFAVMTTGYILFGTWIEERDLRAAHGAAYAEYQRQVPPLIPWTRRRAAAGASLGVFMFFLGKGLIWVALGVGGCTAIAP